MVEITTQCSGCGVCCSPVALHLSQDDVRRLLPHQLAAEGIDERTRGWILNDLTSISWREGITARPESRDKIMVRPGPDGRPRRIERLHYFRCRHFDRETRRCMDYDNRPSTCREYPWVDQPSTSERYLLPAECAFRADLGLPVAEWQPVELHPRKV